MHYNEFAGLLVSTVLIAASASSQNTVNADRATIDQPSIVAVDSSDPRLERPTVPLFLGNPANLSFEANEKLASALRKYPNLKSCIGGEHAKAESLSRVFEWTRYQSKEEAIVCMTAVAQWAESPDNLLKIISHFMVATRKYHTGGSETGAYLVVSGGFDRAEYPRNDKGFWMRFLTSPFKRYSIVDGSITGFSFSYQADGTLYGVKISSGGK